MSALRDRVKRLERNLLPPDGNCPRCRLPHFTFAALLAEAMASEPAQVSVEDGCRCLCCKPEVDFITNELRRAWPDAATEMG
jgi:hypothetical protein